MKAITPERIQEIIGQHNLWLKEKEEGRRADFTFASLNHTDLRYSPLPFADFTAANLAGTDFTSANLQGANFSYANLTEVNFAEANLQGANFFRAILIGTNLTGADTTNVNIMDATLYEVIHAPHRTSVLKSPQPPLPVVPPRAGAKSPVKFVVEVEARCHLIFEVEAEDEEKAEEEALALFNEATIEGAKCTFIQTRVR
jgi:uncharacterized protein YjbI with pentapeptide repeats